MTNFTGVPEDNRLTESLKFDRQRQSGRVVMRVPVEVSGVAEDGSPVREDAHTGVVGAHGAMVRMSCALKMGALVELTNHFSRQTAKFRVVWINDHQSGDLWEIGIESLEPLDDFWGVRFPPKKNSR
jgi:hypothetical protein